CLLTSFT
ncbi:putative 95 family protein, partial [Chlamydia psittaci 84-8471/1]